MFIYLWETISYVYFLSLIASCIFWWTFFVVSKFIVVCPNRWLYFLVGFAYSNSISIYFINSQGKFCDPPTKLSWSNHRRIWSSCWALESMDYDNDDYDWHLYFVNLNPTEWVFSAMNIAKLVFVGNNIAMNPLLVKENCRKFTSGFIVENFNCVKEGWAQLK